MPNAPETTFDESIKHIPTEPNFIPIYSKCLSCADYGTSCRGFDIVSLGDIASVRAFHKAVKKSHGLSLKAIAAAAPIISESTINEYFSNVEKDYKWTTVVTIDKALLTICGNRVGMPPLEHACPISSSEARQQLAAADLKLASAELNLATSLAECESLRRKIADTAVSNDAEVQWLKNDIKLWRRIAFILLGIGLLVLAGLLAYLAYDIAHPGSGIVRY